RDWSSDVCSSDLILVIFFWGWCLFLLRSGSLLLNIFFGVVIKFFLCGLFFGDSFSASLGFLCFVVFSRSGFFFMIALFRLRLSRFFTWFFLLSRSFLFFFLRLFIFLSAGVDGLHI